LNIQKTTWFPTEVYSCVIDKSICDEIKKIVEIEKNNWKKGLLNVKAKTSGWNGLRYPVVKSISDLACSSILPSIFKKEKWKCREAWINFYQKGDSTDIHNHYNSDYCAILLVQSDSNKLIFKNIHNMLSLPKEFEAGKDERINEQDGLFIFFPSWVYHQVEECIGERITVAFNFYNEDY
jgi:hypothetical protein